MVELVAVYAIFQMLSFFTALRNHCPCILLTLLLSLISIKHSGCNAAFGFSILVMVEEGGLSLGLPYYHTFSSANQGQVLAWESTARLVDPNYRFAC